MSDKRPFVKSRDTQTAPSTSRFELDKMLRRYGATQITMHDNMERREIVVAFIVPDSAAKDAQKVPVKLPISIYQVYDALYGRPSRYDYSAQPSRQVTDAKCYDERRLEQAERVAWRNLLLWVDAALSAASVGLQTITEAFFAHAVVGAGGERLIEVIEHQQSQLGAGVQRLLTAKAETES